MKVIYQYPPIIDQIVERFGVRVRHNVIFSWGDRLYNPDRIQIPPELMAHEQVHGYRQRDDIEGWWDQYIHNIKFRLAEEILAHRAELQYIVEHATCRQHRRRALKTTAQRLAAPLYGHMISVKNAKIILKNVE